MNRHKLFKYSQYLFSCFFCLAISLQSFSQVIPSGGAGAPASAGSGAQAPGGAQGGAQGNAGAQQGNANQPTNQQIQDAKAAAAEKGKAANANNSNGDASATDGNQSKNNTDTSTPLSPEEQAKQELRNKIFGSSIFADKKFNPIPDFQIATPVNYVVGPNDELNIYLYNYAEATYKVTVNRDGFINIPLAGNIMVGGHTIAEVRKILIDRLSKFKPGLIGTNGAPGQTKLMVTLGDIRTIKVYVSGEVVNPAAYELPSLASAFNALYLAGGPNEIGTFRDVKVVREGKVIAHLDVYDFFTKGSIGGDIRVQDNDNVSVGYYLKRVEIAGQVKRPGFYELKPDEKLSDLIRYAGGFNDKAYKGRVKLQRITSKERKMFDVSEEQFDAFDMSTGDSINVETVLDRFENIVTLQGAVMRPGDYALENSPTLKKLIDNASGLREDAFVGRVSVLRTRPDLTIQNISLNLADVINNVVPDLVLTRLDQVIVPSKFDMAELAYVHVEGEVNNPKLPENDGKFPYMTDMTLEDLLVQAGGLKESALASEIEVVRRKRDGIAGAANAPIAEVYKFNISRDLSLNASDSHFALLPYDEVIVRKAPNYVVQQAVFLEGEILVPGKYSIEKKNDKISDIIKRAGGLTESAYPEGATLLRRTIQQPIDSAVNYEEKEAAELNVKNGIIAGDLPNVKEEKIGIELRKIIKSPGSFEDLILQEGDIIRIPKRLETVQVNGEVLYPTTVKYSKGMNFSDYISQSGGFTLRSLRKSSYIKYPNGSVDRTRRFLVFNVYPKVEPGSEIFVPMRGAPTLTAQQTVNTATALISSVMTLIVTLLAFRSINN